MVRKAIKGGQPMKPNGADVEKSRGSTAHNIDGSIRKTVAPNGPYYIPSAHVAIIPNNGGAHGDEAVFEQALRALKEGQIGPFLDSYEHVLNLYRQEKKRRDRHHGLLKIMDYLPKQRKEAYLLSHNEAPKLRKGLLTSATLRVIKTYAWWFGGILPIPSMFQRRGNHDNHGNKPRLGLSQLFSEVPGFGAAANLGPALGLFTVTGVKLGLPISVLAGVLGTRCLAAFAGALGPLPAFVGNPFWASNFQAEARAAHVMETLVDAQMRTENDPKFDEENPRPDGMPSDCSYRSEELSEVFKIASGGRYPDVGYSSSIRRKLWGSGLHW